MYPIIFQYKALTISSYGLMLMLAFLICNSLLKKYLKSLEINEKHADDIIFYAAIGGILGSKIYYIVEFWSIDGYNNLLGLYNVFKGFIAFDLALIFSGISQFGSGLVFLGGLIGGLLSVSLYIWKNNLDWFIVSDWVAPYLALGHSIGRIGCFLVGDCYGRPCNLPWSVTFENGLPPTTYSSFKYNYPDVFNSLIYDAYVPGDLISVHPTQLYETIVYFLIFLYLSTIRKTNKIKGMIFFEYLFLAGMSRFIIEFFRLNPSYYFNLTGAQYISLIMIVVSVTFMYLKNNKIWKN